MIMIKMDSFVGVWKSKIGPVHIHKKNYKHFQKHLDYGRCFTDKFTGDQDEILEILYETLRFPDRCFKGYFRSQKRFILEKSFARAIGKTPCHKQKIYQARVVIGCRQENREIITFYPMR